LQGLFYQRGHWSRQHDYASPGDSHLRGALHVHLHSHPKQFRCVVSLISQWSR
jgi:hypothetical protein